MKLFLLTTCVLVALANTKPCTGPRCKRMYWGPYGDGDYGDMGSNDGDTNGEENNIYGGPTNGVTNENTPKRTRGQNYGYTGTNYGYTNRRQNNAYGVPTNGKTNENIPNSSRLSECPNCYPSDFGNDVKNRNTINIEKK